MNIRPCDVASVEAVYLDCCLPCYMLGAGDKVAEVLAVPVAHDTTWKQAYDALKAEFHASSGWFDGVAGSGTLVEEALRSMFGSTLNGDIDAVCDFVKYVQPDPEGENEPCYLYVGLIPQD